MWDSSVIHCLSLKLSTYKLDCILNFSSFLKYLAEPSKLTFSFHYPLTWNHWELKVPLPKATQAKVGWHDGTAEKSQQLIYAQSLCLLQEDHHKHSNCIPGESIRVSLLALTLSEDDLRQTSWNLLDACLQNSKTGIMVTFVFLLFP